MATDTHKFYVYVPSTQKRLGEPGSRPPYMEAATSDAWYKRAIKYGRGEAIKKAFRFDGIAISVSRWKRGERPGKLKGGN